eukprot:5149529-Pyramimonas_sp.AAC.1
MPKRWPADFSQDMRGLAAEAFADLVVAGAFPGSGQGLVLNPPAEDDPPEARVYEVLERHGLVTQSDQEDPLGRKFACWNISALGVRDVAAFEKLRRPSPALERREGIRDKEPRRAQRTAGGPPAHR